MSSIPFWIDYAGDAAYASDGTSRYGIYLQRYTQSFTTDGEGGITTDPAVFTATAWYVATAPVMAPGYVQMDGRILTARCMVDVETGGLTVEIDIATPMLPQLRRLGWRSWDRQYSGIPMEPQPPALLTITRLLVPVPVDRLWTPAEAPERLDVLDAKASVAQMCQVLNAKVGPVLEALETAERGGDR